jgi:Tfp pilus assembly protein PilO
MTKAQQWLALTVAGCLALVVAGWYLLVSPERAQAADLREQATAQDDVNRSLQEQVRVLEARAKALPKAQAALADFTTKVPPSPELPELVRELSAAAEASGVELRTVTPQPPAPLAPAVQDPAAAPVPDPAVPDAPEPTDAPEDAALPPAPAQATDSGPQLAAIPIALDVRGGYFEVLQFLSRLEELPRAFRVTDLSLVEGPEGNGPVEAGGGEPAEVAVDGRVLSATIAGTAFTTLGSAEPVTGAGAAPTAPAQQAPETGDLSAPLSSGEHR